VFLIDNVLIEAADLPSALRAYRTAADRAQLPVPTADRFAEHGWSLESCPHGTLATRATSAWRDIDFVRETMLQQRALARIAAPRKTRYYALHMSDDVQRYYASSPPTLRSPRRASSSPIARPPSASGVRCSTSARACSRSTPRTRWSTSRRSGGSRG
jgi:hypothetical protein